MWTLVSGLLLFAAAGLTIFVIVFFAEIVAATTLPGHRLRLSAGAGARPAVSVLVPAHNEGSGLLPTLANIRGQLIPGDRLLVVADNCSDNTAAVAKAGGAEVVERNDPVNRGKGYALDWGVRFLSSNPCEIVIVVDADCELADGAIDNLVTTCVVTGRPTQALYLMKAPSISQTNYQVAEFSWRVKNWLRPLGLGALNLPCQLMGTGMAFPWKVLRSANLASAQIVEDLKLGLDLTLAGYPPVFCPAAIVTSEFASSVKGARTQRQRWEQGHLDLILKAVPRLLGIALARRDWNLFVITIDLAVPPLSLLAMLVLGILGLSLLDAIFGHSFGALAVSLLSLLLFTVSTFIAWLRCGRDVVSLSALLLLPLYAFRKVNFYRQLILGKIDSQWTRTDRTK
jgi:cellulose synthase/poly-beta-1,6-N-acetylglucosamine synthase-like glycosyltransferase